MRQMIDSKSMKIGFDVNLAYLKTNLNKSLVILVLSLGFLTLKKISNKLMYEYYTVNLKLNLYSHIV